MRSGKSFLILLVLAAGVGAYAYFFESKKDLTADTAATKHPKLVTADSSKVTDLEIHSVSGDVTSLKKSGESWQIVAPVQADADSAEIGSLVSTVTSLEAQRTVDEHPANLAGFGLAPARFSVAYKQAGDATMHRVNFGSKTAAGSDTYAQVEGQPAVVLVSSYVEDQINRGTFDLRDKSALKVSRDGVDQITIEPASGTKVSATKKGSDWRLTAPADARADFGAIDGIVSRLSGAKMKAIVAPGSRPPAPPAKDTKDTKGTKPADAAKPADPLAPPDAPKPADVKSATGANTNYSEADLKAYGLDKPQVVATIGAGSSAAKIAIGGKYDDTTVYARDLSRPVIFTIDKAVLDDIKKKPDDLRIKEIFEFRAFTATAIDLTYGGTTYSFVKEKAAPPAKPDQSAAPVEAWKQTKPSAKDVDQTKLTDLLTNLSNLKSDSFADKAAAPGEDLTVHVKFADTGAAGATKDEQVTLRKSGKVAQAVHPGDPGAAVIPAADLDKILAGMKAIAGK
jgi:hypothetical protein